MSFASAQRALSMFEAVLHGLGVIQGLTKVGGDHTKSALEAISALVTKLQHGFEDTSIDPKGIIAQIEALRDQVGRDNAAADAKLEAKFSETPTKSGDE